MIWEIPWVVVWPTCLGRFGFGSSRAFYSINSSNNSSTFSHGKEYPGDYCPWSVGRLTSFFRLVNFGSNCRVILAAVLECATSAFLKEKLPDNIRDSLPGSHRYCKWTSTFTTLLGSLFVLIQVNFYVMGLHIYRTFESLECLLHEFYWEIISKVVEAHAS